MYFIQMTVYEFQMVFIIDIILGKELCERIIFTDAPMFKILHDIVNMTEIQIKVHRLAVFNKMAYLWSFWVSVSIACNLWL